MAARVTAHVYVASKGGTRRRWLAPGDEVPSWARVDTRLLEGSASAEDMEQDDGGPPAVPPRAGRGSGLEAWLTFAEAHGVGVDSDMSRDDVIAACEAAEVIESEG